MSDLRKGLQAAIDALRSYEYGNSDPTLAKMTADTLDTLLSTADSEQVVSSNEAHAAEGRYEHAPEETDSEQREVRDSVINEALDRIAYLTDSGTFHGYRSEVWGAVARVYDAALAKVEVQG